MATMHGNATQAGKKAKTADEVTVEIVLIDTTKENDNVNQKTVEAIDIDTYLIINDLVEEN